MSSIKLKHRPRRVHVVASQEPPPFEFSALPRSGAAGIGRRRSIAALLAAPVRLVMAAVDVLGWVVERALAVAVLVALLALHVTLWSYAFELGPLAACGAGGCSPDLRGQVLGALGMLAVAAYVGSHVLRRHRRRATSSAMLVLLSFDLAAIMLLLA